MNKKAFSLVEVLIVLGIISLLMFTLAFSYQHWRVNTKVKEVAAQFASDLDRQRTLSKRFNSQHQVVLADDGKSYTVNGTVRPLPENITIIGSTLPVVFNPPYGTVDKPLQSFRVNLDGNNAVETQVRVIGIVGKVILE